MVLRANYTVKKPFKFIAKIAGCNVVSSFYVKMAVKLNVN